MSADEAANVGNAFAARLGRVLVRLLLAAAAYFLAVLATLLAIGIVYGLLSSLPKAPAYFEALSVRPVVLLTVPAVGAFLYMIAVAATWIPAAIAALICEIFALKPWWLYALLSAAIAAGGFLIAVPTERYGWDGTGLADLGIVFAGGLTGGIVYWLVAGRNAGLCKRDESVETLSRSAGGRRRFSRSPS